MDSQNNNDYQGPVHVNDRVAKYRANMSPEKREEYLAKKRAAEKARRDGIKERMQYLEIMANFNQSQSNERQQHMGLMGKFVDNEANVQQASLARPTNPSDAPPLAEERDTYPAASGGNDSYDPNQNDDDHSYDSDGYSYDSDGSDDDDGPNAGWLPKRGIKLVKPVTSEERHYRINKDEDVVLGTFAARTIHEILEVNLPITKKSGLGGAFGQVAKDLPPRIRGAIMYVLDGRDGQQHDKWEWMRLHNPEKYDRKMMEALTWLAPNYHVDHENREADSLYNELQDEKDAHYHTKQKLSAAERENQELKRRLAQVEAQAVGRSHNNKRQYHGNGDCRDQKRRRY